MDVITSPAAVAVGQKFTAAQANSYDAAIDSIVRRVGALAATSATQAIAATTSTTLNNGGTAAWTAGYDSDTFVSATGGTATPLIIPSGKGGLYAVGFYYTQGVTLSSGRAHAQLLINGAAGYLRAVFSNDNSVGGCGVISLAAADTIGLQAYTTTAATIAAVSNYIYCYRIGD